ncbi:lipoate--protein ligase family protein [Kribbella sp. CA-293567]|uniref:lipoate--protein ligase family protein n=1 Tax=Kribbella sp. CA-293567 TaxID=3002436 RepID=UPI0022DE2724|nr:lipoate--protein ligase [Kribbella sp. CA-293567]WBQ08219.1 lipoate--protein ligase [Kribbella sp. CA-293567]
MRFFSGAAGDEAMELALAHALVSRASTADVSEALRIYRPSAPVVVFGRRDTRLPGFGAAVQAARSAGFEPLVRAVGGRPVAYTPQALVIDHVKHEPLAPEGLESRFQYFGDLYAALLREAGIDARVGAVPGEYCPGAHSVNARGVVKLVGTGQRVVRNAWLFSTLVVAGDDDVLRPLLTEIYALLELPFDPASAGSLAAEVPGFDLDGFEQRVVAAYGVLGSLQRSDLDEATMRLAGSLVADHRA